MSSSAPVPAGDGVQSPDAQPGGHSASGSTVVMPDSQKNAQSGFNTPDVFEDQDKKRAASTTPSTPGTLASFDWDDFEARYEKALQEADERELEILKEVDALSKYFKVWASAASAHDDDRAAKRLQTRRRFVNLSEERMIQKQAHYDDVVRAFQGALALLRSK